MAIPDQVRSQVEAKLARFCARKAPPEVSEQLRLVYRIQGDAVMLHEERPAIGMPGTWVETKVAKMRYDPKGRRWSLECADAGGRWRAYRGAGPLPSLDAAIAEIDRDPTGIFWG
jgi:hypothetical protein